MGREEEIIKERKKKLKELRKKGINPYPARFDKKDSVEKALKAKSGSKIKTAGRVMSYRGIGKIIFSDLQDFSGKIQLVFQDDKTPAKDSEFFKKYIDVGDIIGVEGTIIKTKTGQHSLLVKKLELLTKSLLPLPSKWHGLQDKEERYRKRYLDLIMNPEMRELFKKKYVFWKSIRDFMESKDFMEVETPVLENTPGGADANPFITHHNALDIDVYLRISMGELWQKRLMVAGYEKTFELGRQFRNEGLSPEHLQDYSQMEFYWAYADYNQGMELVEQMYKYTTKKVLGTLKFETMGFKIDMGKKWEKYDYEKMIKKYTKIDIYKATDNDIKKKLKELKLDFDPVLDKWKLVDVLWKYCRKKLAGPGFLINQPVEVSPLAKRKEKEIKKVERFQVIIAGSEIGNGYSELNDPLDQEKRFEEQAKKREKGDQEAQMHDKDFVEALKYGMPPTCGFGVSERLFSFLMDKPIKDCVLFPLMKPEK
ncbi:MAG TPA: lysine--tRNA ligase [Bacillota bacterium]|nr:lysine--tRNA ligase [Bacillota bacterium]